MVRDGSLETRLGPGLHSILLLEIRYMPRDPYARKVMARWKDHSYPPLEEREERRTFVRNAIPKGGVGAEVGVDRGGFSSVLLEVAKPRRLYLIDCWIPDKRLIEPRRFPVKEAEDAAYLTVVQRFSGNPEVEVIRAESPGIASRFEDASFDWVYIDAMHDYVSVKSDILAWWPKVKAGGVLAGHDYINIRSKFEVKRVVDEFCSARDLSVFAITPGLKYKDWAIRKP